MGGVALLPPHAPFTWGTRLAGARQTWALARSFGVPRWASARAAARFALTGASGPVLYPVGLTD